MSTTLPLVKLSDICRPTQWPTIPQSQMTEEGYPVFGANGRIGFYTEYNHEHPTVLITCRGATCGTINVSDPKSYVTGNAMALDELDPKTADLRFVAYALNWRGLRDAITGSAQPQITRSSLSGVEIPLPPLSEQKRIADILDKADAIRRKRQEALKEFQCLQNSVFFEMFGDPRKNPFALPTTPLKELLKLKSGDFLPQREMHMDGPHAVYGGNGISGRHSKFMFDQPKIVIGRVGAYCGAVHITEPKSWITDNALYVAEKDDGLTEIYLAEALRLAHLNQYASQSGQPLISGSRIYPVEIMVPPFEQQIQFARIATHLKLAESKLTTTESETTNLFNCLIQFAFKGEL